MEARIVQNPEEFPGCDYLTGSVIGPFIDTGVYVTNKETGRRFGRIYLSQDTIRYLNSLFEADPVADGALRTREYAEGFLDGTRESVGPDLVRIAHDLRRYLDVVAPDGPAVGDSEGDGGTGERLP